MVRWSDKEILAYLNEEIVKNYQPEGNGMDGEKQSEPYDAFCYTGDLRDGGTILPCEDMANYHDVANAIIRSRYSQSDENAIHRHHINGDYNDDATEYEEYNQFCTDAVAKAKEWTKKYIGEQTLKNM